MDEMPKGNEDISCHARSPKGVVSVMDEMPKGNEDRLLAMSIVQIAVPSVMDEMPKGNEDPCLFRRMSV